MPDLTTHQSISTVKLLLIGAPGSGKTGALASLAKDYELFILDYDNGLDILLDPKVLDPALRTCIHFHTLTDKLRSTQDGYSRLDGPAIAFPKTTALLNDWKDGDKSYGGVTKWGPDRILVIDSLTLLGEAIMRYTMSAAGKDGQRPSQPNWGDAIARQQALIETLYADSIRCHVIVTSHVSFIGEEDPTDKESEINVQGYPSALGRKLPTRIGRYFNTIIMAKSIGTGTALKRVLRTRPDGNISLKNSSPSLVKPELPLETGLADLFKALLNK